MTEISTGNCAPESTHLGQDSGLYHCGAKDVVCIEEGVDEGYGSICRAGGIDAPQDELQRTTPQPLHACSVVLGACMGRALTFSGRASINTSEPAASSYVSYPTSCIPVHRYTVMHAHQS